jgi:hypothetical protein
MARPKTNAADVAIAGEQRVASGGLAVRVRILPLVSGFRG